jgi:hypothetical protein
MDPLTALSVKRTMRIWLVIVLLMSVLFLSPRGVVAQSATGVNSFVEAVAMRDTSHIYVGGYFTSAGGYPAPYVAKWDGNSWSHMGTGMNNIVLALAIDSSGLVYAGGDFTIASGSPANRIAVWNGARWNPLGAGLNGSVRALAFDNAGNLYVGGEFTTAGGVAAANVARYNLNTGAWSAMGAGFNDRVNALLWANNRLYAGGNFTRSGGATRNRIAYWNAGAQTWDNLSAAGGADNTIFALAADSSGNVYAGGQFNRIGNVATSYRIAQFVLASASWRALGNGFNDTVRALSWKAGVLYAGGAFTRTGLNTGTFNRVAQWNGASWLQMGSGMNQRVRALVADDVLAGGYFTRADGIIVNYVTLWNGTQWIDLTNEPTPIVLLSFGAAKVANGININWQTVQEINIVGFNVLRSKNPNGPFNAINSSLILAQSPGGLMGASYEFLDTRVEPGVTYYYKLDVVNVSGALEQYGPVSCTY